MTTHEGAVRDALTEVIDPCCRERGISVVDMGLVEEVACTPEGDVRVRLLLTSGWCPFQTDLLHEVTAAVERLPEVRTVDVGITLDRAWSSERLSPAAHAALRFLPDPTEVDDREAFRAARLPVLPTRPAAPAAAHPGS